LPEEMVLSSFRVSFPPPETEMLLDPEPETVDLFRTTAPFDGTEMPNFFDAETVEPVSVIFVPEPVARIPLYLFLTIFVPVKVPVTDPRVPTPWRPFEAIVESFTETEPVLVRETPHTLFPEIVDADTVAFADFPTPSPCPILSVVLPVTA
jgi:hypothetical protein